MKEIIKLMKSYDKDRHKQRYTQPLISNDINWKVQPIFNPDWKDEKDEDTPYEILTHILDSYYMLPERPDIAFGMCWQAINNCYNEMLFNDSSKTGRITDTKGVDLYVSKVSEEYDSKYGVYLEKYYHKYPLKMARFIAAYVLKGYIIDKADLGEKYKQSMYSSFNKRHSSLTKQIKETYGEKYSKICSVSVINNRLVFKIADSDKDKSRKLVGNLAEKIQTLISTGEVELDKPDKKEKYTQNYNNKQRLELVFHSTLYASRCSNFHGNVASRMNSNNANAETYRAYKYVFLVAHMFLGIGLHINGYFTDDDLLKLKKNEDLLA